MKPHAMLPSCVVDGQNKKEARHERSVRPKMAKMTTLVVKHKALGKCAQHFFGSTVGTVSSKVAAPCALATGNWQLASSWIGVR